MASAVPDLTTVSPAQPVAVQAPSTVTLIVDPQQQKQLRNTFVFWEILTFGLGVFVGKKLFEAPVRASK